MEEVIKLHAKPIRLFFFWCGIIATIAYRIIIVLNFYSPLWVKISWYIGTIGFIVYFWHRSDIERKRARLVEKYHLIDVAKKVQADKQQKQALDYIVESAKTSKSQWNSMFIFALSVIALAVGIILDVSGFG